MMNRIARELALDLGEATFRPDQEILVSTLSSLKFESASLVRLVGEGSTSWGLRTCREVVLA